MVANKLLHVALYFSDSANTLIVSLSLSLTNAVHGGQRIATGAFVLAVLCNTLIVPPPIARSRPKLIFSVRPFGEPPLSHAVRDGASTSGTRSQKSVQYPCTFYCIRSLNRVLFRICAW
jgi:hypothetical protein